MTNNLAANIEEIKSQKDGLDVLSDIYIYAVLGEKIDPADLIRFKWYGIHSQNKKDDLFKLKVPVELGILSLVQLKTLGEICNEFGAKDLTITTNQKVEFNNLKIYDIPHIFNNLEAVGLSTTFESGDTVRNVATCAVGGIEVLDAIDVDDIALKLNETFKGSKLFSNLPNSLKISVSGCLTNCICHSKQDIEFKALKNEKDKTILKTEVCGHHIGYVTPSQVVPFAKAAAKLYREYGDREDLSNNSFESLVNSWGIDRFFDVLDSSVNFRVKKLDISLTYKDNTQHLGINASVKKGRCYFGYKPKNLTISNVKLKSLVSLLEKYDISKVKLASMGNLFFTNIKEEKAQDFEAELKALNI